MEQVLINPLGALAGAQDILASQKRNRLADLQFQQAQTEINDKATLRQLLPKAVKGDQGAIDQVAEIDPEMFMKLDENQRAAARERSARLGSLLASVQSVPEELRPLAYNQAAQRAVQELGLDPQSIPPYDPNQLRLMVDQHRKIDDILAQKEAKAPQSRTRNLPDGTQLTEEWNGQGWQPVGAPAPRWAPERQGMNVTLPDGTVISAGGSGPLGTKATNDLQTKKIDTVESLARLSSVREQFKPEYLQFGPRWQAMATAFQEKAGFTPSPEEKKSLEEFSRFKRDSLSNVNRTIKEITGAAMSVEEAKRITGELPNPGQGLFDGDSPTEFKSKLDGATQAAKRAIVRYNYALSNNLDPLSTGIELTDVDQLIDRRGSELEQIFRQQNPQASDDMVQMQVRDQLAREFGLE